MKRPHITKGSYSEEYLELLKQGYEIDPVTFLEMKDGQPTGDGFRRDHTKVLSRLRSVFKWYLPNKKRSAAYDNRNLLKRIAGGV